MSERHDGRRSERSMKRPRTKVFHGTRGWSRFYRGFKKIKRSNRRRSQCKLCGTPYVWEFVEHSCHATS